MIKLKIIKKEQFQFQRLLLSKKKNNKMKKRKKKMNTKMMK
jgi:hypothetical protein